MGVVWERGITVEPAQRKLCSKESAWALRLCYNGEPRYFWEMSKLFWNAATIHVQPHPTPKQKRQGAERIFWLHKDLQTQLGDDIHLPLQCRHSPCPPLHIPVQIVLLALVIALDNSSLISS